MKNGYTPKEFAYSIAIDALVDTLQNKFGALDDLTPADRVNVKVQLNRLIETLADKAKLDVYFSQRDD